jgi:hypothetical protein
MLRIKVIFLAVLTSLSARSERRLQRGCSMQSILGLLDINPRGISRSGYLPLAIGTVKGRVLAKCNSHLGRTQRRHCSVGIFWKLRTHALPCRGMHSGMLLAVGARRATCPCPHTRIWRGLRPHEAAGESPHRPAAREKGGVALRGAARRRGDAG